ncbi:MAG: CAP domain-containing protein [Acidobacteriota bacterium]|nr:CAP domain-containing protein [Acidobacteriota bacterium]
MKKLLLAVLTIAFTFGATLAQGEGASEETRMTLRAELLRMINRDRAKFGLTPVQLDGQASAIADAYCQAQIRNRTTGHFTTDGAAPYMRYSFAGGNDGVSENAAAWSANYGFSDRALYDMMRRSEAAMMSEVAPHDGHRRTILDPAATHAGIGLAWERGEFRLTEEFIRRYVEWSRPLPRGVATSQPILCSGRAARGYDVEGITVHHEALPLPMAAVTANAIETYKLPESKREYLPRLKGRFTQRIAGGIEEVHEEYSDGSRGDFQVAPDGKFAFAIPLPDGPGIYTVVVWVRPHGSSGDAIPASNVSIRLERSAGALISGTR